jgi:CRP-like cAMP-binding protein
MDSSDLDQHLAAVSLFSGLSRRQRGKLLNRARVVEHDAGNEVAKQGEGALAMHVVLDGSARVSVGGEEVRTLGPGDYFGEISMIDGKPRSATVTAEDGLRTLAIQHLAFQELVDDDPSCARELLLALCARIREIEARP